MSTLPPKNEDYGTQVYWEARYAAEEDEAFDWFKSFADLASVFETWIPDKGASILHLGCGNSTLPEDMYAAGWQRIVNVDYSPTVIRTMEKKYSEKMPLMKWVCADIFHLKEQLGVGSALFDIALDKGTLDALLTVKHDPWDPPQDLLDRMHSYMAQVSSVLAPGGAFLHITFAQPHFRKRFLETADFEVQTHRLDGGTDSSTFEYYLYRCVKRQISKSKSE